MNAAIFIAGLFIGTMVGFFIAAALSLSRATVAVLQQADRDMADMTADLNGGRSEQ